MVRASWLLHLDCMRADELALWSLFSPVSPRLTNQSRVLYPTLAGEACFPSESQQPGPVGMSLQRQGGPTQQGKPSSPAPARAADLFGNATLYSCQPEPDPTAGPIIQATQQTI